MQVPRMRLDDLPPKYKRDNDPPGMWTGYAGVLPDLAVYNPRVGILKGMELTVDDAPVPFNEVIATARRLAWERYEAAHAKGSGPWLKFEDFIESLPDMEETDDS